MYVCVRVCVHVLFVYARVCIYVCVYARMYVCIRVWQNYRCPYLKYRRTELLLYIVMIMVDIYIYSFIPASLPYKNLHLPFSAASVKSPFCDRFEFK